MKWDIDKALRALECDVPGTSISRVMADVPFMELHGFKVTDQERARGGSLIWGIALGRLMEPKSFFYGRGIREAYLRARKFIRSLNDQQRKELGVRLPRKSNTYLAAQRKSKGKRREQSGQAS